MGLRMQPRSETFFTLISKAGPLLRVFHILTRKKREPTSGLEPLTCSLRVSQ